MQRYIGVKVIDAEPQDKDDKPGYKVCYPDGYVGWAPKKVFEEAYLLTSNMDFGLAYKAMELGFVVARQAWDATLDSVYLGQGSLFDCPTFIVHRQVENRQHSAAITYGLWTMLHTSLAAKDWKILHHVKDCPAMPYPVIK
jgi:hypothetical protein